MYGKGNETEQHTKTIYNILRNRWGKIKFDDNGNLPPLSLDTQKH